MTETAPPADLHLLIRHLLPQMTVPRGVLWKQHRRANTNLLTQQQHMLSVQTKEIAYKA